MRAQIARAGISQSELARRINRKQPWLNARTRCEVAFDMDDLEVIAEGLGIDPQDLLPPRGVLVGAGVRHQGLEPRTRWFSAEPAFGFAGNFVADDVFVVDAA